MRHGDAFVPAMDGVRAERVSELEHRAETLCPAEVAWRQMGTHAIQWRMQTCQDSTGGGVTEREREV